MNLSPMTMSMSYPKSAEIPCKLVRKILRDFYIKSGRLEDALMAMVVSRKGVVRPMWRAIYRASSPPVFFCMYIPKVDAFARCELCGRRRSSRKVLSGPDDVLDQHLCSRPSCDRAKALLRQLRRVHSGGSKFELMSGPRAARVPELHGDCLPHAPPVKGPTNIAELPGSGPLLGPATSLQGLALSPSPPKVDISSKPRLPRLM